MTDVDQVVAPMPIGVDDPNSDYFVPEELRQFYAADPVDLERDTEDLHDRIKRVTWLYLRELPGREAAAYDRWQQRQDTAEDRSLLRFDKQLKPDPEPKPGTTYERPRWAGARTEHELAAAGAFVQQRRPFKPIITPAIIESWDRALTFDERPVFLHSLRLGRAIEEKHEHDQVAKKRAIDVRAYTCPMCENFDRTTAERPVPTVLLAISERGQSQRYRACGSCATLVELRIGAWLDVPVAAAGGRRRGELIDEWIRRRIGDPDQPRMSRIV